VVNVGGREAFVGHVYNRWRNEKPWMHAYVDLTPWAGTTTTVEVMNRPNAWWNYEWAYWSDILIESKTAPSQPTSWKDKPAWLNSTNEGHNFQAK
jgi:hypothetical protein